MEKKKESRHSSHKGTEHKGHEGHKGHKGSSPSDHKQVHKGSSKGSHAHDSKESSKKKQKSNTIMTIVAILIIIGITLLILNVKKIVPENSDDTLAEAAAIVNGEPITLTELDTEFSRLPQQYQQFLTKSDYLGQMVSEKLLMQEAAKDGISVTDEHVNEVLNNFLNKSPLSKTELEARLADQGLTLDDLRNIYRKQLTIAEYLNESVFNDLVVSNEAIEQFYSDNKDTMYSSKEGEIRASHILVDNESEAKEIIKELEDGADFAELAKAKSIGPSAVNGGDLGYFGKGRMVAPFEDAAFALNVGEISEPVKTQFGWHIIKRMPDEMSLEDVRDEIKVGLLGQMQQKAFDDLLVKLNKESNVQILYQEPSKPGAYSACINDHGLTNDTVIFYFSETCPHCERMKPHVESLEKEGFKVLWADATSGENVNVLKECFADKSDKLNGVPAYICANSGAIKVGEMPEEDLRSFFEDCGAMSN